MTLGRALQQANRAMREGVENAMDLRQAASVALRDGTQQQVRIAMARAVHGHAPLRERLMWFWADHFTANTSHPLFRAAGTDFADHAIRPHVVGRFADMLKAVIRHPLLLIYLDQNTSVGPASRVGTTGQRGLNENLARELLELHTMGAGSGYTQTDIREIAELLTGLAVNPNDGFQFRPNAAQPGAEVIFGRSYGSDGPAQLSDIDAFLEDLAVRPETARHLARKLAVHFLADTPPEDLVAALTTAYLDSAGDLGVVAHTLMTHPLTATPDLQKAKQPFEFVASSLIAFGFSGDEVMAFDRNETTRLVERPTREMGQPFLNPRGPDGWPERSEAWITPQGLATRITWAGVTARRHGSRVDDPRALLERSLGSLAGERLRFAVGAAETHAEGIAILLASAEFNRR
jgi:uncharacterized protein (DUF1800 family)